MNYICINGKKKDLTPEQLKALGFTNHMLVEVYQVTYSNNETQYDLFTNRIATNCDDIENWLISNAEEWLRIVGARPYEVRVYYDNKNGSGYISRDFNTIFKIKTHYIN